MAEGTVVHVARRGLHRATRHVRSLNFGESRAETGHAETQNQSPTNTDKKPTRRPGKRSLFSKAVLFLLQGWVYIHGQLFESDAELAQVVPRSLLSRAETHVTEMRNYSADL